MNPHKEVMGNEVAQGSATQENHELIVIGPVGFALLHVGVHSHASFSMKMQGMSHRDRVPYGLVNRLMQTPPQLGGKG